MISVRVRLAAWYVVVTAVFLVAFGVVTYALLARALQARIDLELVSRAGSFEQSVIIELASRDGRPLMVVAAEEAGELADPAMPLAVLAPGSGSVAGSPQARAAGDGTRWREGFHTLRGNGEHAFRLFTRRITAHGQTLIVLVMRRLDDQTELIEAMRRSLFFGIPLWVACAGALGYWLVRKTLRPVQEMSEEAAAIGGSDLTRRIPVRSPGDELGHLATTFNGLLERVRALVVQQRRFMAETSHELRTPLAIVRGEAEVALLRDRTAEELRASLAVIEQESRLLSAIIDDLFLLGRADAGLAALATTTFYLDELVADVVRSQRTLAAQKSIAIESHQLPESTIRADERLLRRMLMNLLDNAVKYTPAGGRIDVTLDGGDDERYVIVVANTGAPIPEEARTRIFERSYRGDPRASDGAGLGLPIAESIARLHGGRIDLIVGERNVFRVELRRSSD